VTAGHFAQPSLVNLFNTGQSFPVKFRFTTVGLWSAQGASHNVERQCLTNFTYLLYHGI